MDFTEEEIERYSRHIILKEVGGAGQKRLKDASVFMVGAGGLGSPAAMYLAAAGVGTLGIVDLDVVDLSNLQRQILHSTPDVGRRKVDSARDTIQAINPHVRVNTYSERITSANVLEIIRDYDVVMDGSDNFPTRFLMNDACFMLKKPLVSGSMFRFDGQVTVLKGHEKDAPCYRCLYPEPPPADLVPSCQEAGILGVLAGTVGVLQATETLKLILGIGKPLVGQLLVYNAQEMRFLKVRYRKNPKCLLCGPDPKITELLDYEVSCTLQRH